MVTPGCNASLCYITDAATGQLPITDAAGPSVEIVVQLTSFNGMLVNRTRPFTLIGHSGAGAVHVSGPTHINVTGSIQVRVSSAVSGTIVVGSGNITVAGPPDTPPVFISLQAEVCVCLSIAPIGPSYIPPSPRRIRLRLETRSGT
jgi:hypothetical protein